MSSVRILCGAPIGPASEARRCNNRVRYTRDHCRHHGGPAKPQHLSNTFGPETKRFEKGMAILKKIANGRAGVSVQERLVIEDLQKSCRVQNTRKRALVKENKKSPRPNDAFLMHNLVYKIKYDIEGALLPLGYSKAQLHF